MAGLVNTVTNFWVIQNARKFLSSWPIFILYFRLSKATCIKSFNVYESLYRKNILIYIQQDATLHS